VISKAEVFETSAPELRAELCDVVREECDLVSRTGDGDAAEAGVEQVWVDARVGVNENAFGGKALRAVNRDDRSVLEMAMLGGVELDLAVAVEGQRPDLFEFVCP
jgi:hypothetical protein